MADLDKKARADVAYFLQTNFKYTAFVEYVQAWRESFDLDAWLIRLAVRKTEKLEPSFTWMVGSRNGSSFWILHF